MTSSKVALLLCSERSGSNLLRCILDTHSALYAPNTMTLGPIYGSRGAVRSEFSGAPWPVLLREATRRINESTSYTGVSVTGSELAENLVPDDLLGLYLYPHLKGARAHRAQWLVIKEHQGWRIADSLFGDVPSTRIVAQVRDPRAHAASCKHLARLYDAYHGSISRAATRWTKDQGALLGLMARHRSAVHVHRYEDLVTQPQEILQDVCRFLGVSWEPGMLDYYEREAARKQSNPRYLHNMWAHLDEPVSSNAVEQWKTQLSATDVALVERSSREVMQHFGYEPRAQRSTLMSAAVLLRGFESSARYFAVTATLWVIWSLRRRGRVQLDVVFSNAIFGHRPYERFRDRWGYRF
jgi:hypothetical protein